MTVTLGVVLEVCGKRVAKGIQSSGTTSDFESGLAKSASRKPRETARLRPGLSGPSSPLEVSLTLRIASPVPKVERPTRFSGTTALVVATATASGLMCIDTESRPTVHMPNEPEAEIRHESAIVITYPEY